MTEEQTKRYLAANESIAATLKLIERPIADLAMITMRPTMALQPCPLCGVKYGHLINCVRAIGGSA